MGILNNGCSVGKHCFDDVVCAACPEAKVCDRYIEIYLNNPVCMMEKLVQHVAKYPKKYKLEVFMAKTKNTETGGKVVSQGNKGNKTTRKKKYHIVEMVEKSKTEEQILSMFEKNEIDTNKVYLILEGQAYKAIPKLTIVKEG